MVAGLMRNLIETVRLLSLALGLGDDGPEWASQG